MKQRILQAIPHLAAVIVFVVISCMYFSPYFSGYELEQSDISQFLGMSKEIADYEALTGEHVAWTNQLFGGMPAYQISPDYSGNWIKGLENVLKLGLPRPVGILFMAMLGFYILGICVRVNPWLSLVGGVAFGLASINLLYIGAGHMGKVNAIAFMAPVLGGVLLTLRGKLFAGAAVTALFLALHLTANHLQMTYYLVFLLLFAGVAEAIRLIQEGKLNYLLKASAVLIGAAIIAFLPSASTILNTYEYSKSTTRGSSELTINPDGSEVLDEEQAGLDPDYILEYSLGRGEIFSLMIPDVKGGASGTMGDKAEMMDVDQTTEQLLSLGLSYWGSQSGTAGAFYFGVIIVMLFFLGMAVVKDRLKWAFLALTLMALILSWRDATGLTYFFIDHVPGFGKFRDTKMMLVVVQIMMPLVGMMAIDRLIKNRDDLSKFKKPVLIAGGAFAALILLFAASPEAFFDFDNPADEGHYARFLQQSGVQDPNQIAQFTDMAMEELIPLRVEVFKADAMRSLLFTLVILGLLFAFLRKWVDYRILIPVLGILIFVDLYMVDQRYVNQDRLSKDEAAFYPNKKVNDYKSYVKAYDKFYPFTPGVADEQILDREKLRFDDLEKDKEAIYKKRMAQFDKTPRNKELIEKVADFGALGLRTNFRVFTMLDGGGAVNPTQDGRTSYFHKSLGGYHGAKLSRYQDIITFHLGPEMQSFATDFNTLGPNGAFGNTPVINMLNTRYIMIGSDRPAIFNPMANGQAWFVDSVATVASANEEIMKLGELNTRRQAVIHDDFGSIIPSNLQEDPSGYISMDSYSPELITYSSSATSDQLAVFSEIYYADGWNAYVDNEPAEYGRANYILRAMKIPAGDHAIEFRFEPSSKAGLALVGSILVLLAFFGGLFMEFRSQSEEAA